MELFDREPRQPRRDCRSRGRRAVARNDTRQSGVITAPSAAVHRIVGMNPGRTERRLDLLPGRVPAARVRNNSKKAFAARPRALPAAARRTGAAVCVDAAGGPWTAIDHYRERVAAGAHTALAAPLVRNCYPREVRKEEQWDEGEDHLI